MEKPSIAVKKSMRPKRVKIVFSIKCNDLTAHARASIDGSTEISTEDARVLGLMLIALADEEDATATKKRDR